LAWKAQICDIVETHGIPDLPGSRHQNRKGLMSARTAELRATKPVGQGLRERRRQQTRAEITDAALELFAQGTVAATTVDDIASAAGVSPRTFFRYFASKEEAALPVHQEFNAALADGLPFVDPGSDLRREVNGLYGLMVQPYLDNGSPAAQRMLQVSRLIRKEPALRAAMVRQNLERTEEVQQALAARFGPERTDPLELRLAIDIASVVVRASLDTWASLLEAGRPADLASIYRRALEFTK
jgi:AcrR family transcriptional regulator